MAVSVARLLRDLRFSQSSEEIKNKDKADLDNDGQLSSYEIARAKKIEESMAKRRTA